MNGGGRSERAPPENAMTVKSSKSNTGERMGGGGGKGRANIAGKI